MLDLFVGCCLSLTEVKKIPETHTLLSLAVKMRTHIKDRYRMLGESYSSSSALASRRRRGAVCLASGQAEHVQSSITVRRYARALSAMMMMMIISWR